MRTPHIFLLFLWPSLIAGCSFRAYPPVAYLERTAPIYPDARPENCKLIVLREPPKEPFEVFGQIVAYAGAEEMAERMENLIKRNACEAGADAIVLLPMQKGTHFNRENTYPDWITGDGEGKGDRLSHWTDKRYAVFQRAATIVFKPAQVAEQKRPES